MINASRRAAARSKRNRFKIIKSVQDERMKRAKQEKAFQKQREQALEKAQRQWEKEEKRWIQTNLLVMKDFLDRLNEMELQDAFIALFNKIDEMNRMIKNEKLLIAKQDIRDIHRIKNEFKEWEDYLVKELKQERTQKTYYESYYRVPPRIVDFIKIELPILEKFEDAASILPTPPTLFSEEDIDTVKLRTTYAEDYGQYKWLEWAMKAWGFLFAFVGLMYCFGMRHPLGVPFLVISIASLGYYCYWCIALRVDNAVNRCNEENQKAINEYNATLEALKEEFNNRLKDVNTLIDRANTAREQVLALIVAARKDVQKKKGFALKVMDNIIVPVVDLESEDVIDLSILNVLTYISDDYFSPFEHVRLAANGEEILSITYNVKPTTLRYYLHITE